MKTQLLKTAIPILDFVLAPLVWISATTLKAVRRAGVRNMRRSRAVLDYVGVFPIEDHYYEPMFNPKRLKHSLRGDRHLPGIDMNTDEQLALLNAFDYADELTDIPYSRKDDFTFYYDNPSFRSGDAEYLYSMIRHFKPGNIIEVGSGYSTLLAVQAIDANKKHDVDYKCRHICIEPYEMPWLERLGSVEVVRSLVEETDPKVFKNLAINDILFIDSSHIIRPQGDVLFEFLRILPDLSPGVIVHIHDVFTPRDYLDEWIIEERKLWNEQYLLEAFLTCNREFKVIGAVNYLKHNYTEEIAQKCPILAKELVEREPGSFWIAKCVG